MPKRIEFQLPPGWSAPEGKVAGDRVEGVYEIELKENGKACLVSLDDSYLPGYGGDEEKPKYKPGMEKPPGANYAEFPEG